MQNALKKYSWSASDKTRHFITYPQVVNFFLKKYTTDEVIAKTKSNITPFAQPLNMTPFQYAEGFVTRTIRSEDVYENHALNEMFIEGLDLSIHHKMCEYWEGKENANLHALEFHTTFLLRLRCTMKHPRG